MNSYSLTACAVLAAALPFALGVLTASWRQRRRLAERSRTLTVDLGPKVLLGFALSTTAAAPALASTSGAAASPSVPAALPSLDRIARLPSATTTEAPVLTNVPAAAAQPARQAHQHDAGRVHVVRSGESLWSITRDYLGARASNASIARSWPSLWAANRAVVGADPGALFPGQRLHIPATLGDES